MIVASALEPALIASVESMARAYGVELLGAISKPVTAQKLKDAIAAHLLANGVAYQAPAPSFSVDEIAAGLEQDEFEPFFQAKVATNEPLARGAEALARWRHPVQGIIRPQFFIESMEASGLIEALTQVMVAGAARNCKSWRDTGADVTVSINLSLKSLHDVTVADRLASLVEQQGLEAQHVIFEVTETAAASELGRALENLSRLRMKGFGLSIDDYGTGYSSMERLTRIPFTELKIDQTFVKSATTRPASLAALESSLEMAAKLGIEAVAEGVESGIEWDLVRRLGCPLAQGYFVARPMDASEFMTWVLTRERAKFG
jgi:EAL domain-containing protein (putative c-di-GMP-specific phosphodiesterase class I)